MKAKYATTLSVALQINAQTEITELFQSKNGEANAHATESSNIALSIINLTLTHTAASPPQNQIVARPVAFNHSIEFVQPLFIFITTFLSCVLSTIRPYQTSSQVVPSQQIKTAPLIVSERLQYFGYWNEQATLFIEKIIYN
jgi:hypothetical protein